MRICAYCNTQLIRWSGTLTTVGSKDMSIPVMHYCNAQCLHRKWSA